MGLLYANALATTAAFLTLTMSPAAVETSLGPEISLALAQTENSTRVALPNLDRDHSDATRSPTPLRAEPLSTVQDRTLSYPFEQVWPTTIRYLRVDRDFEISERDEEAGYLLFSFPVSGTHKGKGSIEFIRMSDVVHRPATRVQVTTQSGPLYLPNSILDGIEAKLKREQGAPAPPPKKPLDPPREPPP